ncbi:MAG: hypothetical protein K8R36_24250 [Planctomycetales bacterium]|nr:hypothetical protein [Planctomycetales bacterium]
MSWTTVTEKLAEAPPRSVLAKIPDREKRKKLVESVKTSLLALVKEQPEFRGDKTRFLNTGFGFSRIDVQNAVRYLLMRVGDCEHPPQTAVDDLRFALDLDSAEALFIVTLWGVRVDSRLDIANGISVRKFRDLPVSETKQSIHHEYCHSRGWMAVDKLEEPPSAIVKSLLLSPLFVENPPDNAKKSHQEYFATESELNRAALALTATAPSAPVTGFVWVSFVEPRLEALRSGFGWHAKAPEILPVSSAAVTLLQREAAEFVPLFLQLTGKDRDRMEVALTRLNMAFRRHSIGDQALDSAIAIESLLVDDPGENTHKVSVRTGLLYPGNTDQKLRASNIIRALYKARSSVAHAGRVKDTVGVDGKTEPTKNVVKEALSIVATVAVEIAKRGRMPDWRRVELGETF